MAFNGEGPLIKRQRTDAESSQHRVSCLEVLYHELVAQKYFMAYSSASWFIVTWATPWRRVIPAPLIV
jgi:hypothetical protein